ncbi:MAG TPA: pyridoxal phosphate-dependent aminotransferase [Bryobacteraceae bacterium]|nr:pyridoxal phosphate-dependent aminotransferase [Bryobacteraceae bacterium]
MFSSRFHWDLKPNPLTQALHRRRQAGEPILDLTESNPTRAGFAYPPEIVSALNQPGILLYEPSPGGLLAARSAVAAYYAERNITITTSGILLTASTSEAYAYLFKLLCNPGDEVLVPRPSYPLFEFLADMESIHLRQYSLSYHGEWGIDFESLTAAISSRTRAMILVNPNNPTGTYLKSAELESLVSLARDRQIALISDEVFSDYILPGATGCVLSLVGAHDCLTFSMSGLSKVAGLPQMKLGWIVVSGPHDLQAEAVEKLEWIADTYLSVGTPVQHAAASLLEAGAVVQREIRQRTLRNLAFAKDTLAGSTANVLNVEGGWYIVLQVPRTRSEEEWALGLLSSEGVLVQPGYFFDFESEAFLVVSLLTRPEMFAEGIGRLKRYLEGK